MRGGEIYLKIYLNIHIFWFWWYTFRPGPGYWSWRGPPILLIAGILISGVSCVPLQVKYLFLIYWHFHPNLFCLTIPTFYFGEPLIYVLFKLSRFLFKNYYLQIAHKKSWDWIKDGGVSFCRLLHRWMLDVLGLKCLRLFVTGFIYKIFFWKSWCFLSSEVWLFSENQR